MRIACIGWGSLVWNPGALHLAGPWQKGGPHLPIEFARTSKDGRLTLVLLEGAAAAPTRFVDLAYNSPEQAQECLAGREGSGVEAIGLWPGPPPKYSVGTDAIAEWAQTNEYDAVVWTALRPKFRGSFDEAPKDAEDVLDYLRGLSDETSARASEYVRKAPPEVRTAYRAVIESALGWLPTPVEGSEAAGLRAATAAD